MLGASASHRRLRVAGRWIALLARLVPAHFRQRWRDEWMAELWYADRRCSDGAPARRLAVMAAGALSDAIAARRVLGTKPKRLPSRRNGVLAMVKHDVRYAIRQLRRNPGFTAIAILIIGLGVGANTAIFSVVNAVLFRPQPFADSHELVDILTVGDDGIAATSSYLDYLDFKAEQSLFTGVTAYETNILNLATEGQAEAVFGEFVAGNYFAMLGLAPTVGRLLGPADDVPGAALAAVVGYRAWKHRYGADADIIGRAVRLNGHPVTVVGVGPEEYGGAFVGLAVDFWLPMLSEPTVINWGDERGNLLERRGSRSTFVKGRLRPGVTVAQAQAGMKVVAQRLAEAYPATNAGRDITVLATNDVRLLPFLDRVLYPVAALLMAVVALVLVIACSNLANLLLIRAAGRRKEIGVRLAIGANRARVISQLLTESLLLAVAGGMMGIALAYWTSQLLLRFRPPIPFPVSLDLSLDGRVLAFALIVTVGTGLVFGLAPALKGSRLDLVSELKSDVGARAGDRKRFGLRNALVVAQVAVSLLLLIVAGLFVRSLASAQRVDPGFETTRAALIAVELRGAGYTADQSLAFFDELKARTEALAGVEAAAWTDRVPLGIGIQTRGIVVDGHPPPAGRDDIPVDHAVIGPGYFATMGIDLLQGRDFTSDDTQGSAMVVIVSEAMVRRFWPGQSGVGQRFRLGSESGPTVHVVGVAGDTKVRTLGETPRSLLYLPITQDLSFWMILVVRTRGDPAGLPALLRREVAAIDRDVPVLEAKTMPEHLGVTLFAPRMGAGLLATFGILALGLASLGVYGVIGFSVAQRTREVGIRMALGARRGEVLRMVIGEGMALVGVGAVLGLVSAFLAAKPLAGYLLGVGTADTITFGGVTVVLLAVALIASYVPARRAARVDPVTALRYE